MNILHVTASVDPKKGGVSQAIRMMISGLENAGMNNSTLSLDKRDDLFIKNDPLIIALGTGKNPWNYSQHVIPWLRKHLAEYQIVIIHGLWLYHGYAVNRVIQQMKRGEALRSFIMPHGMLDPYFQKAVGRKLKAIRNNIYWNLIERNVVNNAHGLLFTCEEEKSLARRSFRGYNPKQESVVGLGIDEPPLYTDQMRAAFFERCPGILGHSFLLFISRIHEKKGLDLLINAYAEVYGRQSKEEALHANEGQSLLYSQPPRLVIAGPGIETLFGQKIKQLVSGSPFLKDNVYFPGMLSGDAKWGAFYNCAAFILPSHQENFGIAVVEALACGKPVLISDQVNIWREIKKINGGIIANDSEEGATQLLKVWKKMTFQEKLEMGLNARKSFEENFSISLTAQKLIKAIVNS
jgi:glycosyltransferase involved in cell wall biosynthesis